MVLPITSATESQVQDLSELNSEYKASLGNLVRLPQNKKKGAYLSMEYLPGMHAALDTMLRTATG